MADKCIPSINMWLYLELVQIEYSSANWPVWTRLD
jgi:hypothetical protein